LILASIMDKPRSRRRLVIAINVGFGLIAVGILVGVTKYLLVLVGLWAMGASRISAVAAALAGYEVIFVLSLVMCVRAKSDDSDFTKRVIWALAPLVGILWIIVSASYLFGICNFSPFKCVAPVFHWTTPSPIDSTDSAKQPAAVLAIPRRGDPMSNGIDANGQPVKTFSGSEGEIARNRIIDIHACVNKQLKAWFNDDDLDHRPEAQRKRTFELSNACAAWLDGKGPMPGIPNVNSSASVGSDSSPTTGPSPAHPQIFRCPGPGGTTVFTDIPCPSKATN
jgi:hypothetical protein